jgi:hypothetical protein
LEASDRVSICQESFSRSEDVVLFAPVKITVAGVVRPLEFLVHLAARCSTTVYNVHKLWGQKKGRTIQNCEVVPICSHAGEAAMVN